MRNARAWQWDRWLGDRLRRSAPGTPAPAPGRHRIGLALGGGFARGIAHVGVLRSSRSTKFPIHCIAGVSAGAIVAAAYAAGATPDEIAQGRLGDAIRRRGALEHFEDGPGRQRAHGPVPAQAAEELPVRGDEDPAGRCGDRSADRRPGAVSATRRCCDCRFAPVAPIRACSSRFATTAGCWWTAPCRWKSRRRCCGAWARPTSSRCTCRCSTPRAGPSNMFQVVNRCFQIMQTRTERDWRQQSDVVIMPDVSGMEWDGFGSAEKLIQAGEIAALEAVPENQSGWLAKPAASDRTCCSWSRIPSGSSPAAASSRKSTARAAAGSRARTRPSGITWFTGISA